MKIIPVIDLMGSQVVRGVGGRRDEYRPIESVLCNDARPASVGRAFVELGFREVYVADLDAIRTLIPNGAETRDKKGVGSRDSRSPAWSIYEELMRLGLDLWIDAGIGTAAEARRMAQFEVDGRPIAGIVAGLESLPHPGRFGQMLEAVDPRRLIFSLDMKLGVPLVCSDAWDGYSARDVADDVLRDGVQRMIVLDLARVGMGEGVGTEDFCRLLRRKAPQLEITAGGGVRGQADLDSLEQAGCDAALVASALHDGRLRPR